MTDEDVKEKIEADLNKLNKLRKKLNKVKEKKISLESQREVALREIEELKIECESKFDLEIDKLDEYIETNLTVKESNIKDLSDILEKIEV